MQGPRVVYTDTPRKHKNILPLIFPSLGEGLMPGDAGVRGDVFHLFQHMQDTFLPGHSNTDAAVKALKAAFWDEDVEDRARWAAFKQHSSKLGDKPAKHHVRRYLPPPPALSQRFRAWRDAYFNCPDPNNSAKQLFTDETLQLIELTVLDIDAWFYSGELCMLCKPGNALPSPMYANSW